MRSVVFVVVGSMVLVGCVGGQARFKALETGQPDLEVVWQAALEVLQEEFGTVQADRANRIITTPFKVERHPLGLETIPATVIRLDRFPEQVSTYRRRATARLVERGGEYTVLLRVEKQREDTEAATAVAYETYDPTDTSQLRTFSGPPEEFAPVWTPVGSDDELRDKLLERIAQKLKKP